MPSRPSPPPQTPRHGQTHQAHEDEKHHSRGRSSYPETAHTERSTSATSQSRSSRFHEEMDNDSASASHTSHTSHTSVRTLRSTSPLANFDSHKNKGISTANHTKHQLSDPERASVKDAYVTAQDRKIELMKEDLDFFRYFFGLGSSHALLADGINFCQEQIMKLDHPASRDSLIKPFVPRKVNSQSPTYRAILKKSNEVDLQLQRDLSHLHRPH